MATRRFKPAFTATVVPDAVDLLQGRTGPYALMREAVVAQNGKPEAVRTVMAFGPAYEQVSHLLQAGQPIELSVRYSGGTLKVVGLPKERNPNALLIHHEEGRSYGETVILGLESVLGAFGLAEDAIPGIIEDMMSGGGGGECDEDRVFDIDPDLDESHGHIIRPLANAQVEEDLALAIADAIACLPISSYLDDMATLRRQNAAREFMLAA